MTSSSKEVFEEEYEIHAHKSILKQLPKNFHEIVHLEELLDTPIHLQFIGKNCYILVDQSFDFWEVSINTSLIRDSFLERLAKEFYAVFSLIERMATLTQKK